MVWGGGKMPSAILKWLSWSALELDADLKGSISVSVGWYM